MAAYCSLGSLVRFGGGMGQDFVFVGSGEGMLWLAHSLLLLPGLLLLAVGAAGPIGRILGRSGRAEEPLSAARRARPRSWPWVAGYTLLLFALAVLGREVLLLDLPISNDEYSVDFGGRMIAEGELSVPVPEAAEALPLYFTFERQGRLSAMDFPGPLLASAGALRSGLGDLPYALLAALGGLAVVLAAGRLSGSPGAWIGGLLWLLSPMVWSLSLTTHAHLLSRTFVALAVLAYLHLSASEPPRRPLATGAALGLCAGLAFLCRPFESAALLTPLGLHLLFRARNAAGGAPHPARAGVLGALLGWAPAALAFALYNAAITGSWYLPARFAEGAASHTATHLGLWERLGMNLGWNLMMLGVWFLGPLGIAMVYLGLQRSPAPLRVLACGVALHLALALAHEDSGLHLVGPIHYSESAVHLTLLATAGAVRAWRSLARSAAGRGLPAALGIAWLLALWIFGLSHARILRWQAEIQQLLFDTVADIDRPSVVVAEPPGRLLQLRDDLAAVGTWVAELPSPDPFLRDEVLFVYPKANPNQLAEWFPQRDLYHLIYHTEGPPMELRLVRPAAEVAP